MSARPVSATWLALLLATFTGPALAGRSASQTADGTGTVHVTLGDPSSNPPLAAMKLIAQPNSVASGWVTFAVTNTSKMTEHEVLVVSVPDNHQALPYNESRAKVIENSVDKVGDSGDLRPGASTIFAVHLNPGKYLLMCNEPGHYRAGMWEWLAVEARPLRPANTSR